MLPRYSGVRPLLLTFALLAACAPVATAPSVAPVTDAPATATPATAAPATAATPPSPATAQPTPQPSPQPTTPPSAPTRTPLGGLIHNEGQKIVASVHGLVWSFGEAGGSPATVVANYRLNGASLAGSSLRCTSVQTVGGSAAACSLIEIIPAIRLVNGTLYELWLLDTPLGEFVASGLAAATPHVVSVTATQFALTVKFDRRMLHAGDCGTYTWNFQTPGTMEFVRRAGGDFPAAVGGYSSSNAGYRDFLTAFVSQADISADCTTVRFGSGWGGPIGDLDVTVSGIADEDGNLVQSRTVRVTIADEGPPKLKLQTAEKKVIRVAYSEAMDEAYVTDAERYYLNGKLVPASTKIECEVANCAWVRLTFTPSAFAYGADNTLTIVGVRDMAGNAMSPDIVTSGTFQVR
jgi:hypothetical protein